MTKKELSQLYWLNREIEYDKQRLAELESAAMVSGTKITGLPHMKNINGSEDLLIKIVDLRALIDKKIARSVKLYLLTNSYIESVDDCLIRQIMILRHINGLTWAAVAGHIGGGMSPDSCRKAEQRYLRKN